MTTIVPLPAPSKNTSRLSAGAFSVAMVWVPSHVPFVSVTVWAAVPVLLTIALIGPANGSITDYGYNAPKAVRAATSPLLDELPGSDIPAYVRTLKRLRELPVRVVHAGHDPSFGRERLRELCDSYLVRRA